MLTSSRHSTISAITTYERKQEIYPLTWNQSDLSKFMIAAAPYSGPIGKEMSLPTRQTDTCSEYVCLLLSTTAMIRDDKKVLLLQKQQPIKPTIYMYTASGKLIDQIQVRNTSVKSG